MENDMGAVRRLCRRNVKYWRSPSMALRWAAAMQEATKGFRRLMARRRLPALRAALKKPIEKRTSAYRLVQIARAA
jgi:hypothetical protein